MRLVDLVLRVRAYTRDSNGALFTEEDINNFLNEGIDRLRKITELSEMKPLSLSSDEPILLPNQYHHLIAIYGASRCFTQDEQNSMAQVFMDEFEQKLSELEIGIKNGSIIIVDSEGNQVVSDEFDDGVKNVYFRR